MYNELNHSTNPQLTNHFNGYTIHYDQQEPSHSSADTSLPPLYSPLHSNSSYQLKALFIPPPTAASQDEKQSKKKQLSSYLCIDPCPFFPSSGGQCSDTGYITINGQKINVIDTVFHHSFLSSVGQIE